MRPHEDKGGKKGRRRTTLRHSKAEPLAAAKRENADTPSGRDPAAKNTVIGGAQVEYRLSAMPSRRQSSAMLCSTRKPSSTMRIFSSAEYCLRVARRMSFTIRSEDILEVPDFWLISTP
jgi:hypothetical protein